MSTGEDDQIRPDAAAEAPPEETPAAAAAADEDPWPFDEEGVFRIRPREEIDLAPFTQDEPAGREGPLSFSSHDELTLDAFEKAISRKIHERFGAEAPADAPAAGAEGAPKGADELVASVLGALTGKDARTALDEVREQLAAGSEGAPQEAEEPAGAEVIDLAAARRKRQRSPEATEAASRIGDVLKSTVNAFLEDYARKSGKREVQIDAGFLKTHGNALLGNLFQGLAQALIPQLGEAMSQAGVPMPKPGVGPVDVDELADWEAKAEADAEAQAHGEAQADADGEAKAEAQADADGEAKAEAQADADAQAQAEADADAEAEAEAGADVSSTGKPDISIKVDLGSILANLFARRPKP